MLKNGRTCYNSYKNVCYKKIYYWAFYSSFNILKFKKSYVNYIG